MNDPLLNLPVRGSTAWIGLGDFGQTLLSELLHVSEGSPCVSDIESSSRFISVADSDETSAGTCSVKDLSWKLRDAIGELLTTEQSRSASKHGRFVEPAVWLLADVDDTLLIPTWEAIRGGLSHLLTASHVSVRVYLLLRHTSWQDSDEDGSRLSSGCRALFKVESDVADPRLPEVNRTAAFIVSDFDAKNTRYTRDQAEEVASYFAAFCLLADIHHNIIHPEYSLFEAGPALLDGQDSSASTRIFGGVGAYVVEVPCEKSFRREVYARQSVLADALLAPVPPLWQPGVVPTMEAFSPRQLGPWEPLSLPEWRVSLWGDSPGEYVSAIDTWDSWLGEAEGWRHSELVTAFQMKGLINRHSEQAMEDYRTSLISLMRSTLQSPTSSGFVDPLNKFLSRSRAELEVSRAEHTSPDSLHAPSVSDQDLIAVFPHPVDELADAGTEIRRAFEHRPNPTLVLMSALISAVMGWYWWSTVLNSVWSSGIGTLSRAIRGSWVEDLSSRVPTFIDELQQWQPVDSTRTSIRLAVIISAYCLISLIFVVVRERSRVERALGSCHRKAMQWRDTSSEELTSRVSAIAAWRLNNNVAVALHELERLQQFIEAVAKDARLIAEKRGTGSGTEMSGLDDQAQNDASRSEESRTFLQRTAIGTFRHEIEPLVQLKVFDSQDAENCLKAYLLSDEWIGWQDEPERKFVDSVTEFASTWAGDSAPALETQPAELFDELVRDLKRSQVPGQLVFTTPSASPNFSETSADIESGFSVTNPRPLVRPLTDPVKRTDLFTTQLLAAPVTESNQVQLRWHGRTVTPVPSLESFFSVSIESGLGADDICSRQTVEPEPEQNGNQNEIKRDIGFGDDLESDSLVVSNSRERSPYNSSEATDDAAPVTNEEADSYSGEREEYFVNADPGSGEDSKADQGGALKSHPASEEMEP